MPTEKALTEEENILVDHTNILNCCYYITFKRFTFK